MEEGREVAVEGQEAAALCTVDGLLVVDGQAKVGKHDGMVVLQSVVGVRVAVLVDEGAL